MKALALFALIFAAAVQAQPLALPAPPHAALEQHVGATISLDLPSTDESGKRGRLADYFDGHRAVLLVPGYYRCPQLCGLVMHGLIDALEQSGSPAGGWRIVGFSIDAQDTPHDARVRRDADVDATGAPVDLHLLVLGAADAQRLAQQVGYSFTPIHDADAGAGRLAHPASVMLLTPRGTISRYFNGIVFDPREMRAALADAQGDRIGGVTARIALLCAHFDPSVGRHTGAIMDSIRAGSLLLVALGGAWLWRRRHARGGRA